MSYEFFDTAEHALNGESDFKTAWSNFGYWQQQTCYTQACEALARLLADGVGLSADDRVLDLGFGMGEQLGLWQRAYGVSNIIGLNPSASQLAWACEHYAEEGVQLHGVGAEQLRQYCQAASMDKVLALDCAYHFKQRATLMAQIRDVLKPQGLLGLTDLYLPEKGVSRRSSIALRGLCSASRIPFENLHTLDAYRAMLADAGLQLIQHQDISAQVFQPFASWWQAYAPRIPPRKRLKFTLAAATLRQVASHDLLRYGLFIAKPIL